MALSWNTLRALPRLTSYEDAVKHEAAVEPIRRRKPEVKPVGRRSHWYQWIRREENGDIAIGDYHGEIIRYRPNGDVLLSDVAWSQKATQNQMIAEITGIRCETFDGKMWACTSNGRHYLRPVHKRVWDRKAKKWADTDMPQPENIFRRVGSPSGHGMVWVYVNPPVTMVHHIRRKEMRQVMERYAAFTTYATAMDSIRKDSPVRPEEYVDTFGVKSSQGYQGNTTFTWWSEGMPHALKGRGFKHKQAARLCALMTSEDAVDNYKAYLWLNRGGYSYWQAASPEKIKYVVTMHHHKDVLKQVEPSGKTRDRYAWAVPKQS